MPPPPLSKPPHRFLFFRNGIGQATCGDVSVQLRQCPRLPGMQFIEIEYIPRVKRRVVCDSDPLVERNMTDDECLIADAALTAMRDRALAVFS